MYIVKRYLLLEKRVRYEVDKINLDLDIHTANMYTRGQHFSK